jgi:DNA gyrase subunit A
MKKLPGPDFPTAGFIHGAQGIRDAYKTGRGTVQVRARAVVEKAARGDKEAIVVTEIPYQVNKSKLIERIAELANEKIIDEISDVRDESDRDGMRLVMELKKDVFPQVVLNQLYRLTDMQSSFGIINLSIVDGRPAVLDLATLFAGPLAATFLGDFGADVIKVERAGEGPFPPTSLVPIPATRVRVPSASIR